MQQTWTDSLIYCWGATLAYSLTALLWLFLFYKHYRQGHTSAFAGLLVSIAFILLAWSNYQFFVVQKGILSSDLMLLAYWRPALFLAGTLMLIIPDYKQEDNQKDNQE